MGLVVWQLGWVDLDLGSSPRWWAAAVATYCPSRMVEHSKSKSTQPSCQTTSPTLYCNQAGSYGDQFSLCTQMKAGLKIKGATYREEGMI